MGKGDRKSRRGKIWIGTYGVSRPRKRNKSEHPVFSVPKREPVIKKPVEEKKYPIPAEAAAPVVEVIQPVPASIAPPNVPVSPAEATGVRPIPEDVPVTGTVKKELPSKAKKKVAEPKIAKKIISKKSVAKKEVAVKKKTVGHPKKKV